MNDEQKKKWEVLSSSLKLGFVTKDIYSTSILDILRDSHLSNEQREKVMCLYSAHKYGFVNEDMYLAHLAQFLDELFNGDHSGNVANTTSTNTTTPVESSVAATASVTKTSVSTDSDTLVLPRIILTGEEEFNYIIKKFFSKCFTASSNYTDTPPWSCQIQPTGTSAWAPGMHDKENSWLEVDLIHPYIIKEIKLNGRRLATQCTTTYEIHYKQSATDTEWIKLSRKSCQDAQNPYLFDGPQHTDDKTVNNDFYPFLATNVRIYPKSYIKYPTVNWDLLATRA